VLTLSIVLLQLLEYGILKDLSFIMKNINVDSIHYRIFRLIANLAKSEAHIPAMYKHNIHSITIKTLSNTNSDITRYTAIRALRYGLVNFVVLNNLY